MSGPAMRCRVSLNKNRKYNIHLFIVCRWIRCAADFDTREAAINMLEESFGTDFTLEAYPYQNLLED
jgi:hypothetical protein